MGNHTEWPRPTVPVREPQRQREVQQYLQSWQAAQGSALNVALNVDSIAASDLRSSGWKPQVSSDKTLTAFAQLAVLRLNVKRAMVSLIDATTQTILVEATRDVGFNNMASKAKKNDNGDLWLGTAVLSRPDAVCEHSLFNKCTGRDEDGETWTTDGLIVPDCRLDSRFKDRPYVRHEPGVRFYAGVPIISRSGHRIGSYAVSDDDPRDGLTVDELRFMHGVSQAVMEHLEWARDRVDRFKGERIVRGLAAFIEGCSASSDDDEESHSRTRGNSAVRRLQTTHELTRRRTLSQISSSPPRTPDVILENATEFPMTISPKACNSSNSTSQPKAKLDSLSEMYNRAVEVLRYSTLADGVALYGATTLSTKPVAARGDKGNDTTSGSEGYVSLDSSDSDTSPTARPCKMLAYSLADEKARENIEKGSELSLATLERYLTLFPRGKTFSFTEEGAGVSSEDESGASDREVLSTSGPAMDSQNGEGQEPSRRRKVKTDHAELLKKIPGAKVVVFVPLFDHAQDRPAGGCFLWTSVTGRMINLDQDLSYLRAFSNSIMSEVGRINTQKNEAAKTTFIASMSHELRSPLHGILGAAEFLRDTITDSYQSSLISSISTCGNTLLDTLNHVLDYSKINRLSRAHVRKSARQKKSVVHGSTTNSLESLNVTAIVDLAVLVEEVVETVAAGHAFRRLPEAGLSPIASSPDLASQPKSLGTYQAPGSTGSVSILLDIQPKASWLVSTQPGALRRIIMNLFGNALKYTSSGFVLVSLTGEDNHDRTRTNAVIRVIDSGKGMSDEYQKDRLFIPFSQEDSFQPGTGLGLSIVKQIVDSLRGSLEVKSEQGKGTEFDVRLRLTTSPDESSSQSYDSVKSVSQQSRGLRLQTLDWKDSSAHHPGPCDMVAKTCRSWFGIDVLQDRPGRQQPADIYLCYEPPSIEALETRIRTIRSMSPGHQGVPIIAVTSDTEDAVRLVQKQRESTHSDGELIEVIPQPCGPRKLAKVLDRLLQKLRKLDQEVEQKSTKPALDIAIEKLENVEKSPIAHVVRRPPHLEVVLPSGSPPVINPTTPPLHRRSSQPQKAPPVTTPDESMHVLLVDDNDINLQLLVMFMKKCRFTYAEAKNGQEAVERYKAASYRSNSSRRFDFVLMDIGMPVMNGLQATRLIREHEREVGWPSTTVIALTGLASADAQRDAESAGVDVFLAKPVKFAELKQLLSAGQKNR